MNQDYIPEDVACWVDRLLIEYERYIDNLLQLTGLSANQVDAYWRIIRSTATRQKITETILTGKPQP